MDTKRAQEARVDVSSPSSRHDPVVDPNVEDIPPLNVRLAAKRPSPQEVAEHNVTHLPYRAWCETCVASRGVDDPHHRRSFEDRTSEGEIDNVLFDFAFLGLAWQRRRSQFLLRSLNGLGSEQHAWSKTDRVRTLGPSIGSFAH